VQKLDAVCPSGDSELASGARINLPNHRVGLQVANTDKARSPDPGAGPRGRELHRQLEHEWPSPCARCRRGASSSPRSVSRRREGPRP
jgi:hypothetical protein